MRRRLFATAGFAFAALTAAAAALCWPVNLGGATTFVVTHGISMEPGFHTGDLAILHSAPSYAVGEVAAYHGTTLHTIVMHRIVAGNGRAFDFKGDNNGWIDPDHPPASAIVGRLWLRIPHGGTYLQAAHSLWFLAAIGFLVMTVSAGKTRRRARGRRQAASVSGRSAKAGSAKGGRAKAGRDNAGRDKAGDKAGRANTGPANVLRANRRQIVSASLAVAVASGAVAAFAFATPATRMSSSTVTVTHTPTFTYDAVMRPGVTYPDGHAATGQPLYTALLRQLAVSLTDTVATSASGTVGRATATIDVTLANSSGWSTRVATLPAVPVGDAGVTVPIDVPAMNARLAAVARETGAGGGSEGVVTVHARLTADAVVAGRPATATSDASYSLALSAVEVRPAATPAAGATTAGAATATDKPTSVLVPVAVPRTVTVAKRTVRIAGLRVPFAALALVALLVAAGMGLGVRSGGHHAAPAVGVIGARRVDVTEIALNASVVDVTTVEALVRIADRYDRLVMCHLTPGGSTFVVNDDGTSYRVIVAATGARHLRVA